MVQTSSVVVLAAVALASSVMALPVGNSWEQTLAQQQQAVNKLEQTDATMDRQKATSFASEAKAFEAAADRFAPPPAAKPQQRPAGNINNDKGQLRPAGTINNDKGHLNARPGTNSRPGQTTGTQNRLETGGKLQQTPAGRVERPAGGPQKSTSPPLRPAGGAVQKTTKRLRRALPATPPAANRPSFQQTLTHQSNVVSNIKQKDASLDLKEANKLAAESAALRAQAGRLEGKPAPAARPVPARPLSVQEQIAQQNSGINRVEQKFATEDRQKVQEYKADSSLYGQQANRLQQSYTVRPRAEPPVEGQESSDAAPATPAPKQKKSGGKRKSKKSKRDVEDELDFFAREWEEMIEARADPVEGQTPTDDAAAAAAPPAPPAAPKRKHKKHNGPKRSKTMRDFDDESDFYAREWEEFVEELARDLEDEGFYAREWAALEELD